MVSSSALRHSVHRTAVATAVLLGLVMWLGVRWCVPASSVSHLGHGLPEPASAACSMGAIEHLSWWESQLTATAAGTAGSLGLLVLAVIAAVAVVSASRWTFVFDRQLQLIQRLYTRHHPDTTLYSFLAAAFADGVLHPKVPSNPRLS